MLKVGVYAIIYVIYLCVVCAWGKMYNFCFTFKNDKAMELFYEYVITECRKYFGVQNKNVIFRVNYNKKEDFLIIAVFCDEVKELLNNLSEEDFAFTKNAYKSINVDNISRNTLYIVGNELCLPTYEIRYLKFSRDMLNIEICKMCCDMSNKYLKIKKHDARLIYDSENKEYVYEGCISKYNKHWKNRRNTNIDISDEMNKFYL